MEERGFDDIARSFGAATSRRSALKLLAGAAAGGFFGMLGARSGSAAPPDHAGQPPEVPPSDPGPPGGGCASDCCPDDTPSLCGVTCVDLASNPQHCGECGNACASGVCVDGECQPADGCTTDCCPEDFPSLCGLTCVDISTNPNHCGGCDTACGPNQTCEDGQCIDDFDPGDECPSGTVECNGVCVDLSSDPANCGGCDTSCDANAVCVQGQCSTTSAECETGATRPCGNDIGICQPGTQTCTDAGTWGPCEGEVGPQQETCNGLDDDCDGQVDNGALCPDGSVCSNGACVQQ